MDNKERRKSFLEARKKLAETLDKKGIKTLEDVERMIDEGRSQTSKN